MRIMNNITALNTFRQYNIANKATGKSAEKLSSGYRINRAGDDAAGLAISEKMRAQIRGLNMASKNSEDAISLVQTAEGALQETHNILQRMRELAVQSASDTNEQVIDRGALQAEFAQLKEEIDTIAGTTTFNDQKLIDGTFSAHRFVTTGTIDGLDDVNLNFSHKINAGTYAITLTSVPATYQPGVIPTASVTPGVTTASFSATFTPAVGMTDAYDNKTFSLTFEGDMFTLSNADGSEKYTVGKVASNLSANETFSLTFGNLGTLNITMNGEVKAENWSQEFGSNNTTPSKITFGTGLPETPGPKEKTYYLSCTGAADVQIKAGDTGVTFNNGLVLNFKEKLTGDDLTGATGAQTIAGTVQVADLDGKNLTIQVGANQGDEMKINVDKMNTKWLGISNSTIANRVDASRAITTVNDALNVVSTQRAKLGAMQNRLEHKIANLDTSAENLTAAESRIRDVDMAKEMTSFTKANILVQASTSMLAQANSAPQNVLQLLR